jgi:hypothetical protein
MMWLISMKRGGESGMALFLLVSLIDGAGTQAAPPTPSTKERLVMAQRGPVIFMPAV